jgi:hypothetical protein
MVTPSSGDVTSLVSQMPPSGRNRDSAISNNRKNGYNYRMVRARQAVCIEQ